MTLWFWVQGWQVRSEGGVSALLDDCRQANFTDLVVLLLPGGRHRQQLGQQRRLVHRLPELVLRTVELPQRPTVGQRQILEHEGGQTDGKIC